MKHIILSIVVIGIVGFGGYMIFKGDSSQKESTVATSEIPNTNQMATTSSEGMMQATTTEGITDNKKTPHMITLETNYGAISFELYSKDAPKTVENFVTLSNKGFYNGLIFHRVIKGFMIQGGDPLGNGTGGPGYKFADELDPNTASYKAGYKKGVVAMANAGPNTNGSQFFIMAADYPLPNNYTIFGKVTAGQDVVDKINAVQTGANDKPLSPVTIKSVKVE
jgi:cyclophilin family peptidyl-prolyl cis-trans isomerase